MKKLIPILALVMLISSCFAQKENSKIVILPVTIDLEATSIWRTINDIAFFEEQGYTINLPEHRIIDSLVMKSKERSFGNEDFAAIYDLLEEGVFNIEDYEIATRKVAEQIPLIDSFLYQIDAKKEDWDWEFQTFSEHKIVFTLYGTGGSYNPEDGSVTLLTNRAGDFMNYKNPANTIIHEITHMGMESSIVQQYELSHGNKERIVDTFVHLMFSDLLPEYSIQAMGDSRIDKYLSKPKDLNHLNSIVSKLVE